MSAHTHAHSNMPLYAILGSTFLFGMVLGGLGFFFSNTDSKDHQVEGDVIAEGVTIVAYEYGACTDQGKCASYQIRNSGSYTYIVRTSDQKDTKYEDALNKKEYDALHGAIAQVALDTIAHTKRSKACAEPVDAYRYTVEYHGKRYEFDSCVQELETDSFFRMLQEYFAVFRLRYGVE